MTFMFVTPQQCRDALKYDNEDNEDDMIFAIEAASEAIRNYLKSSADDYFDSEGILVEDEVPAVVRRATIYLVGVMLKNPDGSEDYQPGNLPMAVTSLLTPLRDPAIA